MTLPANVDSVRLPDASNTTRQNTFGSNPHTSVSVAPRPGTSCAKSAASMPNTLLCVAVGAGVRRGSVARAARAGTTYSGRSQTPALTAWLPAM